MFTGREEGYLLLLIGLARGYKIGIRNCSWDVLLSKLLDFSRFISYSRKCKNEHALAEPKVSRIINFELTRSDRNSGRVCVLSTCVHAMVILTNGS